MQLKDTNMLCSRSLLMGRSARSLSWSHFQNQRINPSFTFEKEFCKLKNKRLTFKIVSFSYIHICYSCLETQNANYNNLCCCENCPVYFKFNEFMWPGE